MKRFALLGVALVVVLGVLGYLEARSIRPAPFAYAMPVFDSYHVERAVALLVGGFSLAIVTVSINVTLDQLRQSRLWLICLNLYAGLGFAALARVDVHLFNNLAREDGLVEDATALLLLLAAMTFGAAAWRLAGRKEKVVALLSGILSLGFFVLAMEEISWMQRIADFQTPASMASANWQHEANLHNLHTFVLDCLYYTTSGLALVLLPLLKPALAQWRPFGKLIDFIPGPEVALITAPAFFFNFGHWDVLPVQLMYWAAAGAASVIALQQYRGNAAFVGLFTVLGLFIGQPLLLWGGIAYGEIVDSTEYQELFVALGYACFAIGARARLLAHGAADAGLP